MAKKKAPEMVAEVVVTYSRDPKRQEKELKKLVKLGRETGDAVLIGAAYRSLAVVCAGMERRDELLSYALKAVALLEDCGDHSLLSNAYNVLGFAYAEQENNQMSMAYYDKAYQLIKRHRIWDRNRVYALNNLASCYHTLGDCRASIRMFRETLELAHTYTPDAYSDFARYTLNLADSHRDCGEPETARDILASMADWVDKVDFKAITCDYYLRYAILSYQLGDREKGDRLVDEAIALSDHAAYASPLYEDFREAAHALIQNKDWKRAEKITNLMLGYAESRKDTLDQLVACRALADYYSSTGEDARALEYYRRLDSLFETRLSELKKIQFNVHKNIRIAEAEIRKLNRKLRENEKSLSKEPLTGLLNRAALLRLSSEFISTAAEKNESVGAIFIDIDFFKECNDTYGHAKGDEIIKEVARACQKENADNVRFARYGGDEFFGIAHGLRDDELVGIARRICDRMRKADIPNEKNPDGQRVTLSVGVVNVAVTERTNTIIDIANFADKAVYYAKRTGKNAIYMLHHGHAVDEGIEPAYEKIEF